MARIIILLLLVTVGFLQARTIHKRKHISEASLKRAIGDALSVLTGDRLDENSNTKGDIEDEKKEVDDQTLNDEIDRLEKILKKRKRSEVTNKATKEDSVKREIIDETKNKKRKVVRIVKEMNENALSREENANILLDNTMDSLVDLVKKNIENNDGNYADGYWNADVDKRGIVEEIEKEAKEKKSIVKGNTNEKKEKLNKKKSKEIEKKGMETKKEKDISSKASCGGDKKECNKKKSEENKKENEKKDTASESSCGDEKKECNKKKSEKGVNKKDASKHENKDQNDKKDVAVVENDKKDSDALKNNEKDTGNSKKNSEKDSTLKMLHKEFKRTNGRENEEDTTSETNTRSIDESEAEAFLQEVQKAEAEENMKRGTFFEEKHFNNKKESSDKESLIEGLLESMLERKRESRREKLQSALEDLLRTIESKRSYVNEDDLRDESDEFFAN